MTATLTAALLALQIAAIAILALAGTPPIPILILALTALATVAALYRSAILPIATLAKGADMMRGRDFNSRLRLTGHRETDTLVKMFNAMMKGLNTERQRVRETNRYLDLLVDASPLGIINLDYDDNIDLINPAAARILAVDPSTVKGCHRSALTGRAGEAIAAIVSGQTISVGLRGPDGGDTAIISISCYSFIDRGFPRLTIFIEPMTDIIRSTERAAYSRIIRVMAHEINNSMGAVGSTLALLADTPALDTDPDLRDLVKGCGERTSALTKFIDSFAGVARLPAPVFTPCSLKALIADTLPSLRAIARDVTLRYTAPEGEVSTLADPVQIEQVLVNIVKNAVESIHRSRRPDGLIAIDLDPDTRTVTVTDNGLGISPEVAPSIFTPFFTTKSGAAASGIGLTLSAEILRAHGSTFNLTTSPDDSLTRFRFTLPPL